MDGTEDVQMYKRHTYVVPERKFTTGLPVGMMLLSMVAITAYLLVGGASNDSDRPMTTVLPKPTVSNSQ